ncbi:MAG: hypothetical protein LBF61_10345 [Azoarcus sp.]|nr:hypothetical protein [Azoarcus sp.]
MLRLCLMTALWCAALWYALPLDLNALSIPALLGVHAAPPLLAEATWFVFKRIRTSHAERAKKAAEKSGEAEKQSESEAARVAAEKALCRRRAHVECRALWLEVTGMPEWLEDMPPQCTLIERQPEDVRGTGNAAALSRALQGIFEAILGTEPLAWLPVYLLSGDDPENDMQRLEWLRRAWQKAAAVCGAEAPLKCGILPGEGLVAGRVIALFESDPELPALMLLGMDSPLAEETREMDDVEETGGDSQKLGGPGHAVAAVLLSRPGLVLPEDAKIAATGRKEADDYTPYWERSEVGAPGPAAGWGGMPARLPPVFLESLKPFAALCRSRLAACPTRGYVQILEEAIENVFIDAGLREMPGERGSDKKSPEPETPRPPDLGWLLHEDGEGSEKDISARYSRFTAGLTGTGCEIDALEEADNLREKHGDVGAARDALMLAEALIRAAQLQKPVLAAGFGEKDNVVISLARPISAK